EEGSRIYKVEPFWRKLSNESFRIEGRLKLYGESNKTIAKTIKRSYP
ncbi:15379_t:CDS:1, partial [Acaulospora colombiana]